MSDRYKIPKISINNKELPIKDMSCTRMEIIKDARCVDKVTLELIGSVEIEPINVPEVMIKVYDVKQNKYIKFKAIDVHFQSAII